MAITTPWVVVTLSTRLSDACAPSPNSRRPGAQNERVGHQEVLVDQVGGHQRPDQLAAYHYRQIPDRMGSSRATAPTASPPRRTEFDHGTGTGSVRDATYLVVLLSRSVYELSV